MSDDAQSPTPARIAAAHFWTAYRLMLETASNDPNPTARKELTKHMIRLQTARVDGFYKCTDFTEVSGLLVDCLWRIDVVFDINPWDEKSSRPVTVSDVMKAQMSFSLLLDLGYHLRQAGYVHRLMPFLELAIPDNRTADLITEALDSLGTELG